MTSFGVGTSGFVNRRQADWLADLNQAFLTQFGASTNLGPDTVLGQFAGIFSERFALLSEAAQDVYNSANPNAAEGTAVDFLLAVLGLERLKAAATTTNPVPDVQDDGITLPGLVLYGTAGTVVPAGAILQTSSAPTLSFTLDADVTLGPAQNAVHNVVFGQVPTAGTFTLGFVGPTGASLTTPQLPYNASAQQVQAAVRALEDPQGTQPFTDVAVARPNAQLLTLTFGAATPTLGQPSSGSTAQPRTVATPQGLVTGNSVCALNVSIATQGNAAGGTGSATCTQTGPNSVLAGQLSAIGSPQQGLTGVTNPLDCLTGRNVETATEALVRRNQELAARGRGTLAGLLTQVGSVAGVTQVLGFENRTLAAQQTLRFSAAPQGSFVLALGGGSTAPIAAPPTAQSLQAAITALPNLGQVQVTGSVLYGFTFDFNGAEGGQAQPLMQVVQNQTQVVVTPGFGRPPKSFELVVQGGADVDVATAIFNAAPAGIASYGAPVAQTVGSVLADSPQVTLADATGFAPGLSVTGYGVVQGSVVQAVAGNVVTLSIPARSTYAQTPIVATYAALITDAAGTGHTIAFSRPQPVLLYVQCTLVTDFYLVPGDTRSGANPQAQFSPASLATIQDDLIAAAEAVGIGGLVTARGTTGLASAFRDVPGILDVVLAFDTQPGPQNQANIQLLAEQVLSVQAANVAVAFQ